MGNLPFTKAGTSIALHTSYSAGLEGYLYNRMHTSRAYGPQGKTKPLPMAVSTCENGSEGNPEGPPSPLQSLEPYQGMEHFGKVSSPKHM